MVSENQEHRRGLHENPGQRDAAPFLEAEPQRDHHQEHAFEAEAWRQRDEKQRSDRLHEGGAGRPSDPGARGLRNRQHEQPAEDIDCAGGILRIQPLTADHRSGDDGSDSGAARQQKTAVVVGTVRHVAIIAVR